MQQERKYDLEDRTSAFALNTREFVKRIPRTQANIEDAKQLVRSSGSVGANYIEANESLGKGDFAMKLKICRKEAKESAYWLQLLDIEGSADLLRQRDCLRQEAKEFVLIFSAMLRRFRESKTGSGS